MLFTPVATYRRPTLHAFERFLGDVLRSPSQPDVPTAQDEKSFQLQFDLPGISREQLKIDLEGTQVRIETLPEARRQYRGVYELPQEIDAQSSSAKLENGVLSLTLVKRQPVSNAHRLTIE